MTSSSSPGVALMAEGFSYLVGAQVPVVLVNIMRGGPGLGDIAPSQGDYHMSTKGMGHGDKKAIVLAPATVQEAVDMMSLAFELADQYRNPVMVIGDGLIGQMMEPVLFPEGEPKKLEKSWATTGKQPGRARNLINSLFLEPEDMEKHIRHLFDKFEMMEQKEQRWEDYLLEDHPSIVLCAYGTTARICKTAMRELRKHGIAVGLFRPITAWPFPYAALRKHVEQAQVLLTIEMSMGQMVDDVRVAVEGRRPVRFFGRTGGVVPTVEEVIAQVTQIHAAL